MRKWTLSLTVISLTIFPSFCVAAERATAAGKVVQADGKPLEHATVLVYEARVRKGYSVFCPTCWVDCGKRATTDAEGKYSIGGLDPELVFSLLVVRDGYSATFIKNVDPLKGAVDNAVIKTRTSPENPAQFVRGQVVNAHGRPVRDAVVEQQGVTYRAKEDGQVRSAFGPIHWIDLVAVTNEQGEFEIAFDQPAQSMILSVSPRGMASKLFTLPTGPERKTMTVSDGATVRGRLMKDGKPVANAEMGLYTHSRLAGETLPEMRVGTRDDGTFAITNVPAGRIYYAYGKMDSLAARGLAAETIECETKDDGQEVDLGDVQVKAAFTLRGKVVLSDGKPIAPDMRVNVFADQGQDSQNIVIGADGSFEFKGLAKSVYGVAASVKGYRAPRGHIDEVLMNRDVNDLVLHLEPAAKQ
jgi:protocatechuate 3,4-dioxygenase beta subunit